MFIIRLMRFGIKKKPVFRIVTVCNKKIKEYLGYYLPISKCNKVESVFFKNLDRIKILKQHGAQISMRVVFLLKKYYNFYI